MIDLLEHPTLANAAAAAFEIISIEFPQLHLPVIKHLFKQKLFQIVLKKVWAKIETVSEHHLSALVFVFKLTPHQVLCNNITKVCTAVDFIRKNPHSIKYLYVYAFRLAPFY